MTKKFSKKSTVPAKVKQTALAKKQPKKTSIKKVSTKKTTRKEATEKTAIEGSKLEVNAILAKMNSKV